MFNAFQQNCLSMLLCYARVLFVIYSERIQLMPLGDFFCEQYKFANVVNQLELCDGEIGLLTAIMIINPGKFASLVVTEFSCISSLFFLLSKFVSAC